MSDSGGNNVSIEGFDYQTFDHQQLSMDVKLADDYIYQLIDVLNEDVENEQNIIAVKQLIHVQAVIRNLRLAYYGRVCFEDRTWKYGDEISKDEIKMLSQYMGENDEPTEADDE